MRKSLADLIKDYHQLTLQAYPVIQGNMNTDTYTKCREIFSGIRMEVFGATLWYSYNNDPSLHYTSMPGFKLHFPKLAYTPQRVQKLCSRQFHNFLSDSNTHRYIILDAVYDHLNARTTELNDHLYV